MKNIKAMKRLAAFAVAFAAASASADYLYWQIEDATDIYNNNEAIMFKYATVKADGERLSAYDQSGETSYWKLYATGGNDDSTPGPAYFGSFDSGVSSFLVELWGDGDTKLGWQTYSVAQVESSIWHGDSPSTTGATPFKVGAVVPEPTSGLLLLVGGALLALRRRNRA